jgi:3-methylcrotonyl-CoA carboxylase alpha subunit
VIESLLIANRGEIARRIIRTARAMGVRSVAVYSEADASAPHVREADAAVAIGPAPAAESYLNGARIIEAARSMGAAAIHPGYGFLSENADFAEAVIAAGLVWVGPPPAAIRAMGLKDAAKRLMAEAGVPVTPGYLGDDQDDARLATEAESIGWPVMIKAVAGGGGKGMRKVDSAEAFGPALASARREAASAFGDDRVLLEKFVANPRHIEVQVFADAHGNVVHLFERDCSLQRRHQKVVEEAPAPGMDAATRAAICAAAVQAARAVGYQGAGTVEFIADGSAGLRADRIWFMEMNTRLQVEHPVTEAVTGLDLVEWQLRVAAGEPLPLRQDQIALRGAAIEARLYAEDPSKAFLPSTGSLTHFRLPTDLRVDSAVEQGGAVTPYYDPMIAKLIAHGETRDEAVRRLADACAAVEVWPVRTNAGFLARLLSEGEVRKGGADTGFIERAGERLTARPAPSAGALASAAALMASSSAVKSPWTELVGFRLNAANHRGIRLEYEQTIYVTEPALDLALPGFATRDGAVVFEAGEAYAFSAPRAAAEDADSGGDGAVRAPMPGKIVAVHAAAGERVTKGQPLVTLEAMKMEHALTAPFDGVIADIRAQVGDQVVEGAILARVDVPASKK